MLDSKVLVDLVRSSEFETELLMAAWKDLSVESKLQLLFTLKDGIGSLPLDESVACLALKDEADIVRIYAAMFASKNDEGVPELISKDTCELVRLNSTDIRFFDSLDQLTQRERLMSLRALSSDYFPSFIDWLENAVVTYSGEELRDCISEYFTNPYVSRGVKDDAVLADGWSWHSYTSAMRKGWALVERLCRVSGNNENGFTWKLLVAALPFSVGKSERMEVDIFVDFPEVAIEKICTFRYDEPVVDELINHVLTHANRYSDDLIQKISDASENFLSVSEMENARRRNSSDRLGSIMESMEILSGMMENLQEMVQELTKAKKKSLFGN